MALSVDKRITIIDHLRTSIGDEGKLLFSDDQLDAYLRGRVYPDTTTEQLCAQKAHYYSSNPRPVMDLEISSGVADQFYRVDESSKHVQWVSGSAEPPDDHEIEISFVNTNFWATVRDALLILATDRARLTVRSKVGDIETDTRVVRQELMKQIQALAVMSDWSA